MPTPMPEANLIPEDAHEILTVVAEDPETMQDGLDLAVKQIRAAAGPGDRRGVLVTRRSRSLFTVEVSAGVPYGTTMESDRWSRPAVHSAVGPGERTLP